MIKLIDLLCTISDNTDVIVCCTDGYEVGRYNGRDSIPTKYNNSGVVEISVKHGYLFVVIS